MPRGGIILWSGSIATIPTGWLLCDGTGGTPNLRDRFVVGAGSTYAVGAAAGATTVTLVAANLPPHAHSGTTDGIGNHTHYQNVGANFGSGGPVYRIDFNADGSGGNQYGSGVQTDAAGSHSHTFTSGNGPGTSTAFSILPPYYALAYIMKA
jgi:microcystin-dependent protein